MPVKIHNKEYFTVAERLNELNKNVEGNYTLTTDMVYFRDGMVVFKAILQIGENTFVGHAMEKESASMINKTSFVECAETSAIGRALASASYHGSEFCSADELVIALRQQKPKVSTPKVTMEVTPDLKVDVKDNNGDVEYIVSFGKKHNGKKWADVPEDYVTWCAKSSAVDWQREQAQKELNRRSGVPDRPNKMVGGTSEVAYEKENEFDGMPR